MTNTRTKRFASTFRALSYIPSDTSARIVALVEVEAAALAGDDGAPWASLDDSQKDGYRAAARAAAAEPTRIPQIVTMAQAHLALLAAGYLATVNSAIDGLSSPQREQARIWFEQSSEVHRNHPMVAVIAAVIPLSDQQVDELFVAASQITG